LANTFGVNAKIDRLMSQGRNPGLEFANAFGVNDFLKSCEKTNTLAIYYIEEDY